MAKVKIKPGFTVILAVETIILVSLHKIEEKAVNLLEQELGKKLLPRLATVTTSAILTTVLTSVSLPVRAITLITDRAVLQGNDLLDWSSLGKVYNPFAPPPPDPNAFLSNNFSATSQAGLGLNVSIPFETGVTPPFVFQTLPIPFGIPTNFSAGDFVLFTGLTPGIFPAPGNDGPITISFDQPIFGVGTQIAVDDTLNFTAFISAFDIDDNLLGTFEVAGTSSTQLDNSAIFLGLRSDKSNISKLVYSSSVPNRALGINKLSLVTVSASVPEPTANLGLLFLGIIGTGSILKRQKLIN